MPSKFVDNGSMDPLLKELSFAMSRANTMIKAGKLMNRKDIVTVRSFYESRDIFIPISFEQTLINKFDVDVFNTVAGTLDDDFFIPPHAVIYCRSDKMSALNRVALRGVEVSEFEFNRQIELYDEFAKKIRVPLIEIDVAEPPDAINRNLEFGISSIRAAALVGSSVWESSFFRG
jgi:deoxyadenosine/deoxycytidine kinase